MVINGDVRDLEKLQKNLKNQDAIIHLACISNDPSFELNPKLGKEINFDCFKPLILAAKKNGIKHCRIEGRESNDWKLVDAIDIIVHLFHPNKRKFYDLEKMWSELIPKERLLI